MYGRALATCGRAVFDEPRQGVKDLPNLHSAQKDHWSSLTPMIPGAASIDVPPPRLTRYVTALRV
jgi:hypothetical protein